MKDEFKYVVVGSRPWNRTVFDEVISKYPGIWRFLASSEELTSDSMGQINPKYIFFLHWSWKVPESILNQYSCVCFHMTDVPYGRGGSPLQNLIARGHRETKLTALRMVEDFDAGPVYFKESLCLEGSAEEIFIRATYLSAKMIKTIIVSQSYSIGAVRNRVESRHRILCKLCTTSFVCWTRKAIPPHSSNMRDLSIRSREQRCITVK